MNSCKDCVCHLVCGIYAPDFNDILANGARCPAFKKETDFAEVVRCKDCKHATFYSCKNDACYQGIICEYRIATGDENFFCACGERR